MRDLLPLNEYDSSLASRTLEEKDKFYSWYNDQKQQNARESGLEEDTDSFNAVLERKKLIEAERLVEKAQSHLNEKILDYNPRISDEQLGDSDEQERYSFDPGPKKPFDVSLGVDDSIKPDDIDLGLSSGGEYKFDDISGQKQINKDIEKVPYTKPDVAGEIALRAKEYLGTMRDRETQRIEQLNDPDVEAANKIDPQNTINSSFMNSKIAGSGDFFESTLHRKRELGIDGGNMNNGLPELPDANQSGFFPPRSPSENKKYWTKDELISLRKKKNIRKEKLSYYEEAVLDSAFPSPEVRRARIKEKAAGDVIEDYTRKMIGAEALKDSNWQYQYIGDPANDTKYQIRPSKDPSNLDLKKYDIKFPDGSTAKFNVDDGPDALEKVLFGNIDKFGVATEGDNVKDALKGLSKSAAQVFASIGDTLTTAGAAAVAKANGVDFSDSFKSGHDYLQSGGDTNPISDKFREYAKNVQYSDYNYIESLKNKISLVSASEAIGQGLGQVGAAILGGGGFTRAAGAGGYAPAAVGAEFVRGPAVGMTALGKAAAVGESFAYIFDFEYKDAIANGVDPEKALKSSLISSAAQAPIDYIATAFALRSFSGDLGKVAKYANPKIAAAAEKITASGVAKELFKEGVVGYATEATQLLIDKEVERAFGIHSNENTLEQANVEGALGAIAQTAMSLMGVPLKKGRIKSAEKAIISDPSLLSKEVSRISKFIEDPSVPMDDRWELIDYHARLKKLESFTASRPVSSTPDDSSTAIDSTPAAVGKSAAKGSDVSTGVIPAVDDRVAVANASAQAQAKAEDILPYIEGEVTEEDLKAKRLIELKGKGISATRSEQLERIALASNPTISKKAELLEGKDEDSHSNEKEEPVASYEFTTERAGSKYTVTSDGKTTRVKNAGPAISAHHSDSGEKEQSNKTVYIHPDDVPSVDVIYTSPMDDSDGSKKRANAKILNDGSVEVTWYQGRDNDGKLIKKTKIVKSSPNPEVGLHPFEEMNGSVHLGSKINSVTKLDEKEESIEQLPDSPAIEARETLSRSYSEDGWEQLPADKSLHYEDPSGGKWIVTTNKNGEKRRQWIETKHGLRVGSRFDYGMPVKVIAVDDEKRTDGMPEEYTVTTVAEVIDGNSVVLTVRDMTPDEIKAKQQSLRNNNEFLRSENLPEIAIPEPVNSVEQQQQEQSPQAPASFDDSFDSAMSESIPDYDKNSKPASKLKKLVEPIRMVWDSLRDHGIKLKVQNSDTGGGLSYDPQTKTLIVNPQVLAKLKSSTKKTWFKSALFEEVMHAVADSAGIDAESIGARARQYAGSVGITVSQLVGSVYGRSPDELSDYALGHEIVRMFASGKVSKNKDGSWNVNGKTLAENNFKEFSKVVAPAIASLWNQFQSIDSGSAKESLFAEGLKDAYESLSSEFEKIFGMPIEKHQLTQALLDSNWQYAAKDILFRAASTLKSIGELIAWATKTLGRALTNAEKSLLANVKAIVNSVANLFPKSESKDIVKERPEVNVEVNQSQDEPTSVDIEVETQESKPKERIYAKKAPVATAPTNKIYSLIKKNGKFFAALLASISGMSEFNEDAYNELYKDAKVGEFKSFGKVAVFSRLVYNKGKKGTFKDKVEISKIAKKAGTDIIVAGEDNIDSVIKQLSNGDILFSYSTLTDEQTKTLEDKGVMIVMPDLSQLTDEEGSKITKEWEQRVLGDNKIKTVNVYEYAVDEASKTPRGRALIRKAAIDRDRAKEDEMPDSVKELIDYLNSDEILNVVKERVFKELGTKDIAFKPADSANSKGIRELNDAYQGNGKIIVEFKGHAVIAQPYLNLNRAKSFRVHALNKAGKWFIVPVATFSRDIMGEGGEATDVNMFPIIGGKYLEDAGNAEEEALRMLNEIGEEYSPQLRNRLLSLDLEFDEDTGKYYIMEFNASRKHGGGGYVPFFFTLDSLVSMQTGKTPEYINVAKAAIADNKEILNSSKGEIDAAYLDAVKRGDIATAQRMVDEKIEKQGLKIGHRAGFYSNGVPLLPSTTGGLGAGYYAILGGDLSDVSRFAGEVTGDARNDKNIKPHRGKVAIDLGEKTLTITNLSDVSQWITEQRLRPLFDAWLDYQETVNSAYRNIGAPRPDSLETRRAGHLVRETVESKKERREAMLAQGWTEKDIQAMRLDRETIGTSDTGKAVSFLFDRGFLDSVVIDWPKAASMGRPAGDGRKFVEVAVARPSQIKSADPVTYDDAGNVIPLSKRFNQESDSILYSSVGNEKRTESIFDKTYYHAGTKPITPDSIKMDMGAIGFHIGTKDQAEWVSSGKTGKDRVTHISGFKLKRKYANFEHSDVIGEIDGDASWEHPDILLPEMVNAGIIGADDAINLADSWLRDSEITKNHHKALVDSIKKAEKSLNDGSEFSPADEEVWSYSLNPSTYKNKEKLGEVRELIIGNGTIAIYYKNNAEGSESGNSFVILDKSALDDGSEGASDNNILHSSAGKNLSPAQRSYLRDVAKREKAIANKEKKIKEAIEDYDNAVASVNKYLHSNEFLSLPDDFQTVIKSGLISVSNAKGQSTRKINIATKQLNQLASGNAINIARRGIAQTVANNTVALTNVVQQLSANGVPSHRIFDTPLSAWVRRSIFSKKSLAMVSTEFRKIFPFPKTWDWFIGTIAGYRYGVDRASHYAKVEKKEWADHMLKVFGNNGPTQEQQREIAIAADLTQYEINNNGNEVDQLLSRMSDQRLSYKNKMDYEDAVIRAEGIIEERIFNRLTKGIPVDVATGAFYWPGTHDSLIAHIEGNMETKTLDALKKAREFGERHWANLNAVSMAAYKQAIPRHRNYVRRQVFSNSAEVHPKIIDSGITTKESIMKDRDRLSKKGFYVNSINDAINYQLEQAHYEINTAIPRRIAYDSFKDGASISNIIRGNRARGNNPVERINEVLINMHNSYNEGASIGGIARILMSGLSIGRSIVLFKLAGIAKQSIPAFLSGVIQGGTASHIAEYTSNISFYKKWIADNAEFLIERLDAFDTFLQHYKDIYHSFANSDTMKEANVALVQYMIALTGDTGVKLGVTAARIGRKLSGYTVAIPDSITARSIFISRYLNELISRGLITKGSDFRSNPIVDKESLVKALYETDEIMGSSSTTEDRPEFFRSRSIENMSIASLFYGLRQTSTGQGIKLTKAISRVKYINLAMTSSEARQVLVDAAKEAIGDLTQIVSFQAISHFYIMGVVYAMYLLHKDDDDEDKKRKALDKAYRDIVSLYEYQNTKEMAVQLSQSLILPATTNNDLADAFLNIVAFNFPGSGKDLRNQAVIDKEILQLESANLERMIKPLVKSNNLKPAIPMMARQAEIDQEIEDLEWQTKLKNFEDPYLGDISIAKRSASSFKPYIDYMVARTLDPEDGEEFMKRADSIVEAFERGAITQGQLDSFMMMDSRDAIDQYLAKDFMTLMRSIIWAKPPSPIGGNAAVKMIENFNKQVLSDSIKEKKAADKRIEKAIRASGFNPPYPVDYDTTKEQVNPLE